MQKKTRTSTRDDAPITDLSFTSLFKTLGWRHLVFTPKFFIALLVASAMKRILCMLNANDFLDVSKYIANTGGQISGTLLGIVIAGLAIITALANGRLLNILLAGNVLHKLLFPFWLAAAFWGITLGMCLVLYPAIALLDKTVLVWVEFVICFIFGYSTMSTIGLVGNTIQIGLIAAEYDAN